MKNLLTALLLGMSCTFACNAQKKPAASAANYLPQADLMPIGAYYYPEHWDKSQWERDLKKMADLGFEFTHFGEFAWAFMEPEEGKFDFSWLDENVRLAEKYGLKVIMCTPTPTPPAWLVRKHPEILVVNEDGIQMQHGRRLHANGMHPQYQFYIKRVVEQLAKRYGQDPRIWGWQLDNEPHYDSMDDHSEYAHKAFREWLKKKYNNDIAALNKAWGTAFWSLRFNNFEQINIPNQKTGANTSSPHAMLDFKKFNAEQLANSLGFQADILRQHISQQQWITTNYAYYKFLPPVDLFLTPPSLDFASHTMYLTSGWLNNSGDKISHRTGSGMELSFSNEMARSVRGYTGIMELQPGQINWGRINAQPQPGAVRMWLWHSFGLGDRFACTYRFRQPIYGGELYHKGILETDGVTVSPGGEEYVQAIKEMNDLKKNHYKPKKIAEPAEYAGRRTAFLWKSANLWDMEREKHSTLWSTYPHYYTYYESLKRLGSPVTFLTENHDFDPKKTPYMVAPAYQLLDKKLVEKWQKYVEAGGHLVLSVRTGQKDNNGQLWEMMLQEPIWKLIGTEIKFNDQLDPAHKSTVMMDGQSYDWHVWGDVMTKPTDPQAEVWATFDKEFYAGSAAVVHRKSGKGSVTYIGAWSQDNKLEYAVLQKLYKKTGATVLDLPPYVFTEWRDGFWVTVNYTDTPYEAPLPAKAKVLLGNKKIKTAGVLVWKAD